MNTRVIAFYFLRTQVIYLNDLGLYRVVVPIADRNLQRFLLETRGGDDCARIR